jgi:PAS domain S-box-containing protein
MYTESEMWRTMETVETDLGQPELETRAEDPYRALFLGLAAGAARCRLCLAGDQVVDVELVDRNAAFEPFRPLLPRLLGMLSQARQTGRTATQRLCSDGAVLSVTVIPAGASEAMVLVDDVTAHDQLERQARDAQQRFDQVFHGNAAAMVIAHRHDLRILDVNPRWLELFGATRAEVIGRTSVELGVISEQTAQARIAQHEHFVRGYDTELELRTRRGDRLTVLASARPIDSPEGRCTLTTLLDISARKYAEDAFEAAFSASPAGMMLVDAASERVVAVNDRLLEMTHDVRESLVGHRANELALIASPSRSELVAELDRAGRLHGVEMALVCKDGPPVWTLASTEMITLHDRRHRLSVFTDIAGRKQFERRLLTQHEVGRSLAETSELEIAVPKVLEALCRGEGWACGAVWLGHGDGGALRCCGTWQAPGAPELPAVLRELGHAPQDLLRQLQATRSAEALTLDRAPESRRATDLGHAVGFPILRGDQLLGAVVLARHAPGQGLDTAARGLFDSVGHLLGLFVERTRAESSLRELNAELERRVLDRTRALETSNRDLEAFGSSVAHDLRAPLRAICGFSAILIDEYAAALPREASELLGRIHASGDRLRVLVGDLLAYSRLGGDEPLRRVIELDPLVRSVLDEAVASRGLGDRLELRLMPLGTCSADPSLLRSVWTNLIDNALKYSRGRPRIVIDIGRELRAGEVVYYVRDNGVGFDMAYADRLFGVFQRLHTATEFEGTGIGLANVRRIVERHRGRVAAVSELGRGSKFEFTLGAT